MFSCESEASKETSIPRYPNNRSFGFALSSKKAPNFPANQIAESQLISLRKLISLRLVGLNSPAEKQSLVSPRHKKIIRARSMRQVPGSTRDPA
jgi:hypothetical protein